MDPKTKTAKYKSNTEPLSFRPSTKSSGEWRRLRRSRGRSRPSGGRSRHSVLAAKARKKPKHIAEIQQCVTFGSSEDGVGEGERPRSGDKVGLRGR